MNSDHLGKQKTQHAISVEIMNIKTVVIYIPMPNYSLFGESQIVGPNWATRKIDKNFKK